MFRRKELFDTQTSTNITASRLLDADHFVQGEPDSSGIIDNCDVCGFAVGFYSIPPDEWEAGMPRDHWGHATQFSAKEIRRWIRKQVTR